MYGRPSRLTGTIGPEDGPGRGEPADTGDETGWGVDGSGELCWSIRVGVGVTGLLSATVPTAFLTCTGVVNAGAGGGRVRCG